MSEPQYIRLVEILLARSYFNPQLEKVLSEIFALVLRTIFFFKGDILPETNIRLKEEIMHQLKR